jgi:hypothetical protein
VEILGEPRVVRMRDGAEPATASRRALQFWDCKLILESHNHTLLGDEPAWTVFVEEVKQFISADM